EDDSLQNEDDSLQNEDDSLQNEDDSLQNEDDSVQTEKGAVQRPSSTTTAQFQKQDRVGKDPLHLKDNDHDEDVTTLIGPITQTTEVEPLPRKGRAGMVLAVLFWLGLLVLLAVSGFLLAAVAVFFWLL
ncbi:MAG: hypothetical protein HN348_32690, partial [Proteobacteria bacterium]|nr:hypothetical protein [Pseudomonadota bacterium]